MPRERLCVTCAVLLLAGCESRAQPASRSSDAGVTAQTAASQAKPDSLPSLAPLVDAVKASVVNVEVVSRAEIPQEDLELLQFFGLQPRGHPGKEEIFRRGAGSGFVVDPNGLVLTNNHVVEGATSIRVHLGDGRSYAAKIAGRDPLTDVAVIHLEGGAQKLAAAKLGDSDGVRVGDWVAAIGNPFGLASSVSAGIISAKARNIQAGPYDDFLQTDAAINPGNSGGPLFDLAGDVVGMNTAIVGGGAGIGFAVPSNILKALLPQLEKGEEVRRGWLGASVQDLTPALAKALGTKVERGAVVTDVGPGSPGAKAGLRPDDVVTTADGKPVESANSLTRVVGFDQPGKKVTLRVQRHGNAQDLTVELGARPARRATAAPSESESRPKGDHTGNLGLAVQDAARVGVTPHGAVVTEVRPGSAADEAGLAPGMIITEAGGKPIDNAQDLANLLRSEKKGSTVLLRVQIDRAKLLRALPIV
jgi:serine protease Do